VGYKDVFEHHGGSREIGKDIVAWELERSGGRRNLAIVAKAVKITGQAKSAKGSAADVQTQVQQCFNQKFNDHLTNEEQSVHDVWVVSNKEISKEARAAISAAIPEYNRRYVRYIDRNELWGLVKEHLHPPVAERIEALQQCLPEDDYYKTHITVSGSDWLVNVTEKYPGAAAKHPLIVNGTFKDEEMARRFQAAFRRRSRPHFPMHIRRASVLSSSGLYCFPKPNWGHPQTGVNALRIVVRDLRKDLSNCFPERLVLT